MSRHLVANDPYDEILNDIKEHMTCEKIRLSVRCELFKSDLKIDNS